jgi:hypothetical protein
MNNISNSEQKENDSKVSENEFHINESDANFDAKDKPNAKTEETITNEVIATEIDDSKTDSVNSDNSQTASHEPENNQNNTNLEPNRIYKNAKKHNETEEKSKVIKLQNIGAGCTVLSFIFLEIPLSTIGLILALISLSKINNLNLNGTETKAIKRRSYFILVAACISLVVGLIIFTTIGSELVNMYSSYSNVSAGQSVDSSTSSVWG